MFTVTVNEVPYRVWFDHKVFRHPAELGTIALLPWRAMSRCTIQRDDGATVAPLMGYARCSWSDVFERAKGRKLSMSRALEHMGRDFRRAVWTKYWEVLESSRQRSYEQYVREMMGPDMGA